MSLRQGGFFIGKRKGGQVFGDRPPSLTRSTDRRSQTDPMILSVSVVLNEIYRQGRHFNWQRPKCCPRCGSVQVWGHGFVAAFFDGFAQCVYLRRYRCPDCRCVMRMKPKGYFNRFRATSATIRVCITHRLSTDRWTGKMSRSRQRHWLRALRKKAMAFFGVGCDLTYAFDRLVAMGHIPVSRSF